MLGTKKTRLEFESDDNDQGPMPSTSTSTAKKGTPVAITMTAPQQKKAQIDPTNESGPSQKPRPHAVPCGVARKS
jgi:hypothetical protein